jgi:hypothetical protein
MIDGRVKEALARGGKAHTARVSTGRSTTRRS